MVPESKKPGAGQGQLLLILGCAPPTPTPTPVSEWGALVPRACSDLESLFLFCPWSHLPPLSYFFSKLSMSLPLPPCPCLQL